MKLLSNKAGEELTKFLLAHEYDIAWNDGDFGGLQGAFLELIGRTSKRNPDENSDRLPHSPAGG